MGAAIVTNGSATLWPFRDDTFPSRNAISKAPRAAAIAVAISSLGTGLTTSALQRGLSVVGGSADLLSRANPLPTPSEQTA